eukprot:348696-Prorocentrum_minimum.AAC.1
MFPVTGHGQQPVLPRGAGRGVVGECVRTAAQVGAAPLPRGAQHPQGRHPQPAARPRGRLQATPSPPSPQLPPVASNSRVRKSAAKTSAAESGAAFAHFRSFFRGSFRAASSDRRTYRDI